MSNVLLAALCGSFFLSVAFAACDGSTEVCAKDLADEAALVQKDFHVHQFEAEQWPGMPSASQINPKGLNINHDPRAGLQQPAQAAPPPSPPAPPQQQYGQQQYGSSGIPGIPTAAQINPKGLNIGAHQHAADFMPPVPVASPQPPPAAPPSQEVAEEKVAEKKAVEEKDAAGAAKAAAEDEDSDDEQWFKKNKWCPTFTNPDEAAQCGMMVITKEKAGADEIEAHVRKDSTIGVYRLKTLSEAEGHPVMIINYPLTLRRDCCELMATLKKHPGVEYAAFDKPDKKKNPNAGTEYMTFQAAEKAKKDPKEIVKFALDHPDKMRPIIAENIEKHPKEAQKWFDQQMPAMLDYLKEHPEDRLKYDVLREGYSNLMAPMPEDVKDVKATSADKDSESGAGTLSVFAAFASVCIGLLL